MSFPIVDPGLNNAQDIFINKAIHARNIIFDSGISLADWLLIPGNEAKLKHTDTPQTWVKLTLADIVIPGYGSFTEVAFRARHVMLDDGRSLQDLDDEPAPIGIPPLSVARTLLTATSLGDGVIFAGGEFSTTPSDVVDRYDMAGAHTTLAVLSQARSFLSSASLSNGDALVAGGSGVGNSSGIYYGNVDRYTPAGVHTTLTALSPARDRLTGANLGDDAIFGGGFTGWHAEGGSGIRNEVDRYNAAGTRTSLTALAVSRQHLAAAMLGNGDVIFAGGISSSLAQEDVAERYTPAGVRTTLTSLSVARYNLAAAMLGNGDAVFAGGFPNSNAVDRYTSAGVRTTLANLSNGRSILAGARVGNDIIFAGGSPRGELVDRYNNAGVRTTEAPLSVARSVLAAATLGNGDALVGGGTTSSNTPGNAVEKYTP